MKLKLLLLFLAPFMLLAQPKRSMAARKLFDQGIKHYQANQPDEAINSFKQCIVEDSTYSEAFLNLSYLFFERKDYSTALQYGYSALKFNRFESSIYTHCGRCHYHLENYDSSSIMLAQGISYGAKQENDYLYLAKSYTYLGKYRESTSYFSKAIELNDSNSLAYNERGNAYFQLGEYDAAKTDFEKALSLNPQSSSALSNMANVLLALGQPEEAVEYIDKGIASATDEQKVQLLILKGNYFKSIGDLTQASEAYNQAYELDQNNAIILNNQASILIEQEDFQGAFEKCNEAIDINPEMMEAYFNRGIANEMLRNIEDACLDWEQAFILGSSIAEEYLNSPVCTE